MSASFDKNYFYPLMIFARLGRWIGSSSANDNKATRGSFGLLLLIGMLVAGFSSLIPERFLSYTTFSSMAFQLPELGLLTLAMFIAILSGGLNLSIIATANVTALFIAWYLLSFLPINAGYGEQFFWLMLALVKAAMIASFIGLSIGFIVAKTGAHPILVTLAAMMMVNGMGIVLTSGTAISGMPAIVRAIGEQSFLFIPVTLWIFIAASSVMAIFLGCTRTGKLIYMSGSNINATWFSGINTSRILIIVYIISSLLCLLAGLIMMARFNSARIGYGDSYLLITVLAIILGGADPYGGFGTVRNIVLSLIALQILSTGLNLMNINPHFSLAMWGMLLISVLILKFLKNRYVIFSKIQNEGE